VLVLVLVLVLLGSGAGTGVIHTHLVFCVLVCQETGFDISERNKDVPHASASHTLTLEPAHTTNKKRSEEERR
jgi:hypothetical protein